MVTLISPSCHDHIFSLRILGSAVRTTKVAPPHGKVTQPLVICKISTNWCKLQATKSHLTVRGRAGAGRFLLCIRFSLHSLHRLSEGPIPSTSHYDHKFSNCTLYKPVVKTPTRSPEGRPPESRRVHRLLGRSGRTMLTQLMICGARSLSTTMCSHFTAVATMLLIMRPSYTV